MGAQNSAVRQRQEERFGWVASNRRDPTVLSKDSQRAFSQHPRSTVDHGGYEVESWIDAHVARKTLDFSYQRLFLDAAVSKGDGSNVVGRGGRGGGGENCSRLSSEDVETLLRIIQNRRTLCHHHSSNKAPLFLGSRVEHLFLEGHAHADLRDLLKFFSSPSPLLSAHCATIPLGFPSTGYGGIGDTLHTLSLSGTRLTEKGAQQLAALLFHVPTRYVAAAKASHMLSLRYFKLPFLVALDMDHCAIGDKGCIAIAGALLKRYEVQSTLYYGTYDCIRRWSIETNHITSASCPALAKLLRYSRRGVCGDGAFSPTLRLQSELCDLRLGGNSIGDEGVTCLLIAAYHRLRRHTKARRERQYERVDPPVTSQAAAASSPMPLRGAPMNSQQTLSSQSFLRTSQSPHRQLAALRASLRAVSVPKHTDENPHDDDDADEVTVTVQGTSSESRGRDDGECNTDDDDDEDDYSCSTEPDSMKASRSRAPRGICLRFSDCALSLVGVEAVIDVLSSVHEENLLRALALEEETVMLRQQLQIMLEAPPSSARGASSRVDECVSLLRRTLIRDFASFRDENFLTQDRNIVAGIELAHAHMGDRGVEMLVSTLHRFHVSATAIADSLHGIFGDSVSLLRLHDPSSTIHKSLVSSTAPSIRFTDKALQLTFLDLSGVGCTSVGCRTLVECLFGGCWSTENQGGSSNLSTTPRFLPLACNPSCCTLPHLKRLHLGCNRIGAEAGGVLLAAFTLHAYGANRRFQQQWEATDPFFVDDLEMEDGDDDVYALHKKNNEEPSSPVTHSSKAVYPIPCRRRSGRGRATSTCVESASEAASPLVEDEGTASRPYHAASNRNAPFHLSLERCGLDDRSLEVWVTSTVLNPSIRRGMIQSHILAPSNLVHVDLRDNMCTKAALRTVRDQMNFIAPPPTEKNSQLRRSGATHYHRHDTLASSPLVAGPLDALIDGNLVVWEVSEALLGNGHRSDDSHRRRGRHHDNASSRRERSDSSWFRIGSEETCTEAESCLSLSGEVGSPRRSVSAATPSHHGIPFPSSELRSSIQRTTRHDEEYGFQRQSAMWQPTSGLRQRRAHVNTPGGGGGCGSNQQAALDYLRTPLRHGAVASVDADAVDRLIAASEGVMLWSAKKKREALYFSAFKEPQAKPATVDDD